jgi:hypothetical protein
LVGSTTTRLQRQAANQKKCALKAVLANLKQLVGVGDLLKTAQQYACQLGSSSKIGAKLKHISNHQPASV